jgi:hypothetical protein
MEVQAFVTDDEVLVPAVDFTDRKIHCWPAP